MGYLSGWDDEHDGESSGGVHSSSTNLSDDMHAVNSSKKAHTETVATSLNMFISNVLRKSADISKQFREELNFNSKSTFFRPADEANSTFRPQSHFRSMALLLDCVGISLANPLLFNSSGLPLSLPVVLQLDRDVVMKRQAWRYWCMIKTVDALKVFHTLMVNLDNS